jgi:endonuclease/exonuclease/phosphatase family metal-dependent hydrolase
MNAAGPTEVPRGAAAVPPSTQGQGWSGVLRLLMQWITGILLVAILVAQLSPVLWIGTVIEPIAVHCAILLALCMLYFRRQRWWSGAIVLAIVLACWPTVWQAYAARAPVLSAGAPGLTIASANVMWSNPRIDAVTAILLEIDVDVLVIHEPTRDLVRAIRRSDRYPYLYDASDEMAYGIALFSRHPLMDVDHHLVLVENDATGPSARPDHSSQVRVLSAIIDRPDAPRLRVVCAHPPSPLHPRLDRVRAAVFERLALLVQQSPLPVVLAADLNLTASSQRWRILHAAGWRRPAGVQANTWLDTRLPRWLMPLVGLRIDHVLVGPRLAIVEDRILPIPGSDHAGVIATVALRGPVVQVGSGDRDGGPADVPTSRGVPTDER